MIISAHCTKDEMDSLLEAIKTTEINTLESKVEKEIKNIAPVLEELYDCIVLHHFLMKLKDHGNVETME